MRFELEGKQALVTGGSGDIGRAICLELARAGARVAFSYFSDHEGAHRTREGLEAVGQTPSLLRVNFGDAESTQGFLQQVSRDFGRIDVLVHAAASGVFRSPLDLGERHVDWALDVNTKSLLWLVQCLMRPKGTEVPDQEPLITRGACIVALSSLGAERAIPEYAALGLGKAALVALARQLALELGPRGVRINIVSPGLVETRALKHIPNRATLVAEASRRTPLGRLTRPENVATVVAFLCSEAASMVHGQVLHVDGGYNIVG